MSEHSNAQIVREWYETRDQERLMSPDVVHEIAEGFPYGGTYRGREEAFGEGGFFARLLGDFPDWRADVARVLDAGEIVVSTGRYKGHAASGGAEVDVPFVHLWQVEDGKISRFSNHTDTLVISRATTRRD